VPHHVISQIARPVKGLPLQAQNPVLVFIRSQSQARPEIPGPFVVAQGGKLYPPLPPERPASALYGRILTLPPGKAAPGYSFLNLQGYDGKPAGLPYQSGAVSGCACIISSLLFKVDICMRMTFFSSLFSIVIRHWAHLDTAPRQGRAGLFVS
jgi:hypothetical protein